jgi:glutamine---fructose-6-phosphate transaminase (isomerizing)
LQAQAVDPSPGAAVRLGGLMDHLGAIRRSRRVLFVACGTSYHACMACRQTIEQLTNMPVRAPVC